MHLKIRKVELRKLSDLPKVTQEWQSLNLSPNPKALAHSPLEKIPDKMPSVDDWIDKMWSVHTMGYRSALKF